MDLDDCADLLDKCLTLPVGYSQLPHRKFTSLEDGPHFTIALSHALEQHEIHDIWMMTLFGHYSWSTLTAVVFLTKCVKP